MSIDVSQFVAPENKWEGLTNISDKLEKSAIRDNAVRQEAVKGKDASLKFFTNYLDKKDKFTGTPYDPKQYELIDGAFVQAQDLIKKGASDIDIMTAIHPLVAKANDYNLAAKNYAATKKDFLANASKKTGIDLGALSKTMDEKAFYEIDPKTNQLVEKSDYSSINPDASIYADLALKEGDVFTNEGFNDFATKSKTNTHRVKVKTVDSKGKAVMGDAEVEGQNYLVPDLDTNGRHIGLVPKYNIAKDAGNDIIHTFKGENGGDVDAPIRLLSDDVFFSLPPETLGYVRQEARKFAKEKGIPLNSSQAEAFAKAIAYDELNSSSRKQENTKFVNETKEPKAAVTKITVNNGKGGSGEVTINDVYGGIESKVNEQVSKGNTETRVNSLSSDEQKAVLEEARKLTGDNELSNADIILSNRGNGIEIYKIDDDGTLKITKNNLIGNITPKGINFGKQPSVKEKRSVIQKAKDLITGKQKQKTFDVVDPQGNVVMQGVDEATANKAKAKGYKIK